MVISVLSVCIVDIKPLILAVGAVGLPAAASAGAAGVGATIGWITAILIWEIMKEQDEYV